MPSPNACTCARRLELFLVRRVGGPSPRRLVAQSADTPIAIAPETRAEPRADEALVLVHAPRVHPHSERGLSVSEEMVFSDGLLGFELESMLMGEVGH